MNTKQYSVSADKKVVTVHTVDTDGKVVNVVTYTSEDATKRAAQLHVLITEINTQVVPLFS